MDGDHDELAAMQMKANQVTDEVLIYICVLIVIKQIKTIMWFVVFHF